MLRLSLSTLFLTVLLIAPPDVCLAGGPLFPANLDESKYQPPSYDDGTIPSWVGTRADEPFDVRGYLESRRAPKNNAAPLYIYALSRFTPDFEYLYPEKERAEYTKRTRAFADRAGYLIDAEYRAENKVTAEEIQAFLNEARPFMEMIDAAQMRSDCVFSFQPDLESLLPFAQQARTVARICQLEIEIACEKGDFEAAEKSLRRGYRLARDLRPRGAMICQLVSIAIDAVLATAVTNCYLASPKLNAAACDRLLEILKEHQSDPLNMADEGLKFEYMIFGCTLMNLWNDKSGSKGKVISGLSRLPLNPNADWEAANPLFAKCLERAQDLGIDKTLEEYIDARLKQIKAETDAQLKSPLTLFKAGLGLGRINSPIMTQLLFPAVPQFFEACRRQNVRLNGVILLTAVRRYELQHGRLPETLEQATKEAGIQELPIDLYSPDRHPMRYTILEGKPIVYSVATDGVDDGGKVDWKFREPGDYLFKTP